jgi:type IV pilus assembly protein PilF
VTRFVQQASLYLVILIFSGSAIVGCGVAPIASKDKEKANYHLEIGTSFLLNGRNADALRSLLEGRRLDPDSPEIRNNLGLAYFSLNKYDLAHAEFTKALELSPNYTDARNNLGGVLLASGKTADAIKILNKASQDLTYTQLQKVFNNLGLAYFRLNEFEKSKSAFQKALSYEPGNCQALTYLGRSYYDLTQYEPAVESLDRAVQTCTDPYKEESVFYSGLSLLKRGQKSEAAGRFREVLGQYPKGIYANKARELLELSQ